MCGRLLIGEFMRVVVRTIVIAASCTLALAGCASGSRSDFGIINRDGAYPIGFPGVRFSIEDREAALALEQGLSQGVPRGADGHFDLIALSGGGSNGAYTAGLITAWTERGDRPDFEVVTGVSTGALAAPFVFLGPDYDDELREAYTSDQASDLLQNRGLRAFVGSGVFRAGPLRELIETYIDAALLERIAAEHNAGRTLLVATTDLDSERGVIWNMGAIAARGGPEALELFRDVLQASASIPGAFPPVMIHAQRGLAADGAPDVFSEMHVDGGVMNPFVALPQMLWTWDDQNRVLEGGRVWVIVNGKADPELEVTIDAPISVAERALNAALKANLRATLIANAAFARRNAMEYHVAAIPEAFEGGDGLDFSKEARVAVFDLGRARMIADEAWTHFVEENEARAR